MSKAYSITIKKTITIEMEVFADDELDARRQAEEANQLPWYKGAEEIHYTIKEKVEKTTPDWVKRVPTKVPSAMVVVGEGAKATYSKLEQEIVNRTHSKGLTDTQRDKLRQEVIVYISDGSAAVPTKVESPIDLYETDKIFQDFANEKVKSMAVNGASNSKIVDTLYRYEAPHGWIAYRDSHQVKPVENEYKEVEKGSSGFSSSVKKVEDDSD